MKSENACDKIYIVFEREVFSVYQVGQKVIYGIHGVCCITAVEVKCSGKEKKEFYCLEPVEQPGAVFYVPTANPAAVAKLRPILTVTEFEELITTQKERKVIWIEDENQRKQRYRELISQNDRGELISMVSALYRHKRQQEECGRKFHICDENFLRDATRLISSEFSLVLGISPSEVADYMKKMLED